MQDYMMRGLHKSDCNGALISLWFKLARETGRNHSKSAT
jgi:hypothetical protein